ncbi:MAG TPA: TetR/AcrR family transcriptional regulator [Solirubrobacteraceae bacterium]|nr:TetR/AcrR family transcriptional regulator [Solirubrobacteraceae bacterium]
MTTLRADAERNRERVLEHATRVLTHDPGAGVAEVAHAAGVGRATLYRHFPTREALLAGIYDRALQESETAIAASRIAEGTAAEALERLVAALLEVGDRYRFLLADDAFDLSEERRRAREARLRAPLLALIDRGQASGELSRSLDPGWMLTAFGAVLLAAQREIAEGRLERGPAARIVTATLLHGISTV